MREFPTAVRRVFGLALYLAQLGETPPEAKALRGFHGAGVLELIEDYDRSTYRAVYTVRYEARVYVLHAFQKKSKRGIATPQRENRADPSAVEASRKTGERDGIGCLDISRAVTPGASLKLVGSSERVADRQHSD